MLKSSPEKRLRGARRGTLDGISPMTKNDDVGVLSLYSSKYSESHLGHANELENLKRVMKRHRDQQNVAKAPKLQSTFRSRRLSTQYTRTGQLEDNLLRSEIPKFYGRKEQSKSKVIRMTNRVGKVKYLFYPQDSVKEYWDLFITVVLFVTCILTPYNIAFSGIQQDIVMLLISTIIDFFFLFDIIIIFNTAFYDDEFHIVEDRCKIANSYVKSWFVIDFLSIFPFDHVLMSFENVNDLARLARLGRMYKLIKMLKLLRVLKIVKDRSRILKYLNEFLKIGLGFERIFFFIIIYMILLHVMTCVFIIAGQLRDVIDETKELPSWIDDYSDSGNGGIYLNAMYFAMTTVTTVGYGDLGGVNTLEYGISILCVVFGAISFSFAQSALATLMSNYDQANAQLQEKINVLNRIYKQYYLPLELYQRLKHAIKYDFNKDKNDINHFVEFLPHKMKMELSLHIHEKTYKKIELLQDRPSAFITWICPLLKPREYPRNEYVYLENDDVTHIYFLSQGTCGFVLPKYHNATYIEIKEGQHIGIIDIVHSVLQSNYEIENWFLHKDLLQRHFTIMSLGVIETMTLSIQDLQRMKTEFHEAYQSMFKHAISRLKRAVKLKVQAIRICSRSKDGSFDLSAGEGSDFNVNLEEPQNLTKQIGLSKKDNEEIK